jgi:hypothetical protein
MRTGLLTAAALLLAALATAAAEPEAARDDVVVPDTDAQFFAELGYKPVATASDTARALLILVSEGETLGGDFDACRAALRQRGILPDAWLDEAGPDDPTTKGHLARLLCKALGIRGGLWMRLLGPLPRLALNECAYLDLMVSGCEYRHVLGGELVGVIDRADRFRAAGTPAEVPKLEGEPSGARESE